GVELLVGAGGSAGGDARMAARDGAHGRGRTLDSVFRNIGRVRIAGRLSRHGTKAKTLRRVEGRGFEAPVVEREGLALTIFEEQLAVVGTAKRVIHRRLDTAAIHARAGEEQVTGIVHVGLQVGARFKNLRYRIISRVLPTLQRLRRMRPI